MSLLKRTEQPLLTSGQVLIPKARIATDFFSRFLGLMGRKSIPSDEAVIFPKCNSIHTFFMRFPIDVVLVGRNGQIVDVIEGMKPWRLMLPRRDTKHIIEMRVKRCRELGIVPGLRLEMNGKAGGSLA